ncbi:MAG: hypothetical protein WCA20_19085 [Candidatus Sulfotelmatobacter sp.]
MKKDLSVHIVVMTLLALLAIPRELTAQEGQKSRHQPHHYQLVDVGTLGGPQSYIADSGIPGGKFVNNSGIFTDFADTTMPDLFQSFCFNADCFVSPALRWRNGSPTPLGALVQGVSSAPTWISENGLIAGFSQNGELDPLNGFPELRAVLWESGGVTNLGTLPEGGFESVANAVNNRRQVVGAALNTIPDPNSLTLTLNFVYGATQVRAFLWNEESGMQDLGTLGGTDALGALINDHGQVMGWSYTSLTQPGLCFPLAIGSFIWDKENGMRNIGSFGGTCTLAQDLNNRGQIVGYAFPAEQGNSRAFLWEGGSFRELGGSLGGNSTGAFVVNDAGQAAGFGYLNGDTFFHATLWKQIGQITDLGTIGSDPCSSAKAINMTGQVVGDSISLGNCLTNGDASRAFLWEDGAIFDLNALIPPGSPLYLVHPQNINDEGEIAGFGVDASNNQHAFLLVPCDENHPGVEGCDYSLADAATQMSSIEPAMGKAPGPLSHSALRRRNQRSHFATIAPRD